MIRHGLVFVEDGFRPAIVKEGSKWSQVVIFDGCNVRVIKTKDRLTYKPLIGGVCSLQLLAKQMLRPKNVLGLKMHISKAARGILTEAANQTSSGS